MVVLGEHLDGRISLNGDGDTLQASSLDATSAGRFFELLGASDGMVYISDLLHPLRRGDLVGFLFANPVPYQRFDARGGWVPGDTGNDEVPVYPVDGVEAHSEGEEIFPSFHFWVPKVSNSGAVSYREGIAFTPVAKSQRPVVLICYERVAKDRLSEHFCSIGQLRLV